MRRVAALVAAGWVAGLVAAWAVAPAASAAPAPALSSTATASRPPALTLTVTDMDPWTPARTTTRQPLTITVQVHNTTGSALDHVTLSAGRGNPVTSQFGTQGLDTVLADHKLPSGLRPIPAQPTSDSTLSVPAFGTVQATFRTTTSTSTSPTPGICLCANSAYPVYLSATGSSGTELGFTRTWVASTAPLTDTEGNPLRRVGVSWVWPLIDVPHRLADAHVFTDRTLPTELERNQRLSRALKVVEDVGVDHPMTLVVDPELIDEVAVLAGGRYSYLSAAGKTERGDGKVAAAAAWLDRLRQVIDYPDVRVEFTPYADPDIQSLTSSHLGYHTRMNPTMLARVVHALGGRRTLPSTVSWLPGGAADQRTLTRIAGNGATDVILDGSSVRPTNLGGLPASAATLHTRHGDLSAALTSPAMQSDVAAGIAEGTGDSGPGDLSHLPSLLAEIAVRADTQPYEARTAFLAAPRYVDPDVASAEAVIRATTTSTVAEPSSLSDALTRGVAEGSPKARARHLSASTPTLSPDLLASAHDVRHALPALYALLVGSGQTPTAKPLLAGVGRGLQRIESAAFLSTSTTAGPRTGVRRAAQLRRQTDSLLRGVYIVRPDSDHGAYTYTLTSKNSPLPITIDNTLPYRVFVHIEISTVGGLPGLTTGDIGTKSVAADSKQTFRVPAHLQRSGRFALTATLSTPGRDHDLGAPVRLTVHSTVVGTIGIVITVVAAIVLVLALLVRYIRRIQRLRRKRRASSGLPRVPEKIGT